MTNLPFILPQPAHGSLQKNLALFAARVALVFCAASPLAPMAAFAELQVGGTPDSVTIDAQSTTIKEILDTLSKKFDVRFQSTAGLDKQLTGTYEGSLPRVLKRVLEGYNVIIKTNKNGIEVTVLGTRNGTATASTSPAPAVAQPQPVAAATPVVAAASPVASSQPATAKAAEQPPLAGPSGNANASPAVTPPTSPSSQMIVLAEGAAPPMPSAGSQDASQNAFPIAPPTNVAPPTPQAGATQATFAVGKPTTTLPPVPAAGAAPSPAAGNSPK